MIGILHGELGKTFSTRTFYAFALGSLAFGVLNAVVIGAASGDLDDLSEKKEAITCLPILLLAWGLVGVAGEYRHRTAAPAALAARSSTVTVLAARIVAYSVTGLLIGAIASAGSIAIALPLMRDMSGPALSAGDIASVVGANLVASVLSTILGATFGAMIRNQVVGVVAALVLYFAVVPLVSGASESLMNLTPFGAASVLSGMTHTTTLSAPVAGLVLAGWTAVGIFAALVTEGRRDLA